MVNLERPNDRKAQLPCRSNLATAFCLDPESVWRDVAGRERYALKVGLLGVPSARSFSG